MQWSLPSARCEKCLINGAAQVSRDLGSQTPVVCYIRRPMSVTVTPSPVDARDNDDPGDETQRNFRYQHAYGVILLIAANRGQLPYNSLWCEQHEDFLGERQDGLYDAYQIKTATPEDGPWVWTRPGLRDSVRRFARLHRKYPDKIRAFFFVSNVECLDSHAVDRIGRSPIRLIEAIGNSTVVGPIRKTLEDLQDHCECSEGEILYVLERTRLHKGPGRDSFDDEIAHSHLSTLEACSAMTAAQRTRCLDALIQVVYRASALAVPDPSRHWYVVAGGQQDDPYLRSKRIDVSAVQNVLGEMAQCPFSYVATTRPLSLGTAEGRKTALEQKLLRGGLMEYVDLVRDRAVSAERHLIELAHLRPAEIDALLNQVTAVVKAACDEARLDASQHPAPYGLRMLRDVHSRLRHIADKRPEMVYRQPYELLAGVAGMLTEDCRVWWSERFALDGER